MTRTQKPKQRKQRDPTPYTILTCGHTLRLKRIKGVVQADTHPDCPECGTEQTVSHIYVEARDDQ